MRISKSQVAQIFRFSLRRKKGQCESINNLYPTYFHLCQQNLEQQAPSEISDYLALCLIILSDSIHSDQGMLLCCCCFLYVQIISCPCGYSCQTLPLLCQCGQLAPDHCACLPTLYTPCHCSICPPAPANATVARTIPVNVLRDL